MINLVSKITSKKNKRMLLSEKSISKHPFNQVSKFVDAYLKNDRLSLARAAHAVFYWPSFTDLFKDLQPALKEEDDDGVLEVRYVTLKRRSKKKKLKTKFKKKQHSKVKGENVSDEPDRNSLPEEVIPKDPPRIKKTKKAQAKKVKATEQKVSENTNFGVEPNWSDWTMNRRNKVNLSDFTKWLNHMDQDSPHTSETPIKKTANTKLQKKDSIKAWVKNSINLKDDIVSEPLAKLMASQGHHEEAIKMYEKLSLIFPEKSTFFAGEIDKLKNKL